jgi:hypothetical protein
MINKMFGFFFGVSLVATNALLQLINEKIRTVTNK